MCEVVLIREIVIREVRRGCGIPGIQPCQVFVITDVRDELRV